MKVRLNYGKVAAGVYEAMEALDEYTPSASARLSPGRRP